MTAQPEALICVVCREPATLATSAECNWCDGRYHLNQRNDLQAKDCGQVWVDEQFLALQFACNTCLTGGQPAEPQAKPSRTAAAPAARRRYRRRA
jgi:hypothetical protein